MFLLIAYCHSLRLEGRESMASDCYSHDERELSHLINLLWRQNVTLTFQIILLLCSQDYFELKLIGLLVVYLCELRTLIS